MHACMHACMYVCMYVCMHACMYVCMYVCVCVCVCACVCMHVCMYACMYREKERERDTHRHTHTHLLRRKAAAPPLALLATLLPTPATPSRSRCELIVVDIVYSRLRLDRKPRRQCGLTGGRRRPGGEREGGPWKGEMGVGRQLLSLHSHGVVMANTCPDEERQRREALGERGRGSATAPPRCGGLHCSPGSQPPRGPGLQQGMHLSSRQKACIGVFSPPSAHRGRPSKHSRASSLALFVHALGRSRATRTRPSPQRAHAGDARAGARCEA